MDRLVWRDIGRYERSRKAYEGRHAMRMEITYLNCAEKSSEVSSSSQLSSHRCCVVVPLLPAAAVAAASVSSAGQSICGVLASRSKGCVW